MVLVVAGSVLTSLATYPEAVQAELPMVALASRLNGALGTVYGVMLLVAMFCNGPVGHERVRVGHFQVENALRPEGGVGAYSEHQRGRHQHRDQRGKRIDHAVHAQQGHQRTSVAQSSRLI